MNIKFHQKQYNTNSVISNPRQPVSQFRTTIKISLSLRGPRLADTRMSPFWILLELRMMEVTVTTGAIDVQSSSPNVTTNKPTPFCRLDAFLCCPLPNRVSALKDIVKISHNLITSRHVHVENFTHAT